MSEQPKDIFQKCADFRDAAYMRSIGMYPYYRAIEKTCGNEVICDGQRKIMIGSNNYLGLAHDERVLEAAQSAIRIYGSGCTGSRILSGTLKIHQELEEELAHFLGREAVLVFSTGFFVNQGALATLLEAGDFILCDRENHASILDGCRFSTAKTVPYAHNNVAALRKRLARLPKGGGRIVVADGVFSMSGDLVDLPGVVAAAKEYGARVYIDEAHSLGVYGAGGEGVVRHFGLDAGVDLVMGTFSKSLGSMGGFLAGPQFVIDYLKHKARCFLFTAALAPAVAGGVLKALQILQAEPELIARLWRNARKMHEGFRRIGFNIGTTQSPIVPILIGSEKKAFIFSQKLYEAGIFTTPAIFPAVRYGQAVVRTSYMASHTDEELDYVLETFERIGKELGVFQDAAYSGDHASGNGKKGVNGAWDFLVPDEDGVDGVRAAAGGDSPHGPVLRTAVPGKRRQDL
ncbi:MAG: aminotransferase class I/II-fold pyridoxal phosphate-dependent enzyme [Gemmataceae bacterium]